MLPNRQGAAEAHAYRYGFGGHEKDDEVKGEGNHYDFGNYGLDVRIGRRFQIDPLIKKFPNQSPYMSFFNNPIRLVDPTGMGPQDKIHIYSNGRIEKEETDDDFNDYYYHDEKGSVTKIGSLGVKKDVTVTNKNKSYVKDMVNFEGINNDHIETKDIASGNTYLDENVAATLLVSSYLTKIETGKKTYINQLNGGDKGSKHSTHGSLGSRMDIQFFGKEHVKGRLHATDANFDSVDSKVFVDNMILFGVNTFYSQASAGSSKAAIAGTKGGVNPHHHHLHADVENLEEATVKVFEYKPVLKKETSNKTTEMQHSSITEGDIKLFLWLLSKRR